MALATYANLQTAVGSWSFNRTDLPATDLIALGEARLNRDLRLRIMETTATLTGVVGARTIALPTGYMEPLQLWREDASGPIPMVKAPPGLRTYDTSGEPIYWAIEGETVAFERPCAEAYSFTLRCLARFALSDTTTTNWLLTNHPDAYLSAALVEAALWAADDEQALRWQARYQAAIDAINAREAKSREAPLKTDIPAAMGHSVTDEGYPNG